jgi:hypothetical protein
MDLLSLSLLSLWTAVNIAMSIWMVIASHELGRQEEMLKRWSKRLESRLIDRQRI